MSFKVFISHSTADMDLVDQLKRWLEVNGIEAYVAQIYPHPGISLADKVKSAIQNCDCFIALLTKDGARSEWVREEIGIAFAADRPVVPIVEIGTQVKGVLVDKEYIRFDRFSPVEAINQTVQFIHDLKLNKELQERTTATLLFLLGLLAVAAISSRNKEEVGWR